MNYKLLLILLLFCISSTNNFAQYLEKEEGLVSRQKPGIGWFYSGFKPYEEGKLRKYDRFIIDLTYNDWEGDRTSFESPWYSLGVNVALMFDKVITKKNTFSIGYGLSFSHYNNKSSLIYERDFDEETTSVEVPSAQILSSLKRQKFTANYIEAPIEFRFRTKGRKHFKFLIGGKIGYQINAFTQSVIETNNQEVKSRNYTFSDNNRLRYGATVRIGIRNFALYGAYHFSPLFENSESTQLNPIELGLSISLF